MLIAALAPLVVLAVGFAAYCLRDLFRSPVEPPARWWWAAFIVFSIPLGGIVWLLAGRPSQ
ncbi:MAG: PLDc N-terminal domain-containing protein [Actinobacteria bacterium]|nr:PLDc N-terminal domain-containing protein [Actinomycetota bacterium]